MTPERIAELRRAVMCQPSVDPILEYAETLELLDDAAALHHAMPALRAIVTVLIDGNIDQHAEPHSLDAEVSWYALDSWQERFEAAWAEALAVLETEPLPVFHSAGVVPGSGSVEVELQPGEEVRPLHGDDA